MRRIRRPNHATVVAYVALFVALSGGTAVALNGTNTVQSDDLGPGAQVKAADVAANAVGTNKVINNTLTGADVNESSLGQVPSALLGGFGRWNGNEFCNPESPAFIPCAVVTLDLPKQARLLLVGQAMADKPSENGVAVGACQIGTTAGALPDTRTIVRVETGAIFENLSVVGVTGPFPPGQHSFGIDCGEGIGEIQFQDVGISAVAISPG